MIIVKSDLAVKLPENIVQDLEYFIRNEYKIGIDQDISWDKMLRYLSVSLGISNYNKSQ